MRFNSRSVLSLVMLLVHPSGIEPASQRPGVYSASRFPETNPGCVKAENPPSLSTGRVPTAKVEIAPYVVPSTRKFKADQCPHAVFGCWLMDLIERSSIEEFTLNATRKVVKGKNGGYLVATWCQHHLPFNDAVMRPSSQALRRRRSSSFSSKRSGSDSSRSAGAGVRTVGETGVPRAFRKCSFCAVVSTLLGFTGGNLFTVGLELLGTRYRSRREC